MFLNSFDIENINNIYNAKKKTPYQKLYEIYELFEKDNQLKIKLNDYRVKYDIKNQKRIQLQSHLKQLKEEYTHISDINELNKKDTMIFETSKAIHNLNCELYDSDKFYEIKYWTLKNNQCYTIRFLDESFYKKSLNKLEMLFLILKKYYHYY